MRVFDHGAHAGSAGAPPVAAIVNGQEIDALLIVPGAGIVVIGDHLAIAMEKEEVDRSRVIGQKKPRPEHHTCFHLYLMILGAGRRGCRFLPGIKQRRENLGAVQFFVCSSLLHLLPFACVPSVTGLP